MKRKNKISDMSKALTTMKAVSYLEMSFDPFGPFDPKVFKKELATKYKNIKLREYDAQSEKLKEIFSKGITNTINPHYEYFIGRPQTRREDFIQVIQKFLDATIKGDSLVIIDPYVFPEKYDNDYSKFFIDILKIYFPRLKKLTFVTSARYNHKIQSKIFSDLQKIDSSLKLILKKSELFHDRFWLFPASNRGIIMGTSLNGLGKKYSIIDYIQEDDARIILSDFKKLR